MPLRNFYARLDEILSAAGLDDLTGLQVVAAQHVTALHHPPLNPDFPAVLTAESDPAAAPLWRDIQRVLRNQYPDAHPVQIVFPAEDMTIIAAEYTLEALDGAQPVPGAWFAVVVPPLPQMSSFERFQETIAHLRAPEGCPWDRKQTHRSLRPYLLEETYEVLDALDSGDMDDLREELGDLLLQIVLHSQIAVGAGTFSMADVIATINAKIIRRHPHVWGEVNAEDEDAVKVNWDRLKQQEKGESGRKSRLDGVSQSLPALSQAFSYQDRAARVKFDWDTIAPVIAKVHEEIEELQNAPDAEAREGEVGDLLFAVVNWARWLGVEPESALRSTNARFYRRFHYIEQQVAAQNLDWDDLTLGEMDELWEQAKSNGL